MQLTENIFYTYCRFEMELWGFVFRSKYGTYHIALNDRLVPEIQRKVLNHEMNHIENDLPNEPYIIGIDCQHLDFEKKADEDSSALMTAMR
ncbi:hypothetical protein SAMN06265827_10574 [Orenia metallireducens]|uniref:IrrE N-terminal-like domain-containing protein n=1 Tax=Orenia metallireducens TaxID=1413210 RepID=A0A285G728_9FIRM|nr:hypothetical protein [Orenia metallireducens]SNY19163.1 hypothetical protein SAMN06265827_10574 [Orenia metallireducens]